jgi:hypothetical protein
LILAKKKALAWQDEMATSPLFSGVEFLRTNMYRNEIDDYFVQCPKFSLLLPADSHDLTKSDKYDA